MISLIYSSNGNSDYPGNFTKEEITLINRYLAGKILNLFSGRSLIGHERIDYSCNEATKNMDVFEYLTEPGSFDTVIIDAPYNTWFADKYKKIGDTPEQFIIFASAEKTTRLFTLIEEKIKPAVIIIKSWNYYIPAGYNLEKLFVCYPGGYRKSTMLLIAKRRKTKPLGEFLITGSLQKETGDVVR